ncbi:hypothetical protein BC827DRAFT_1180395 [Russula dissimulans]|nr:hypothetical protein BC827DRAFT_1180395 [Russula dissimulans]
MFPSVALAGATLLLALVSPARPAAIPSYDHDALGHVSRGSLQGRWYQGDDHFAHALFKRQAPTPTNDSASASQVGSAAWTAQYPQGTPNSAAMPQAWTEALNAAVQAGKIPNIPVPVPATPGAVPVYPQGTNPDDPSVCSWSYGCTPANVTINAPEGVMALSFDDGPLPTSSDNLNAFLKQNQVHATHFYIGSNVLNNWNEFLQAYQNEDDLAIHTWTHPYMTGLSNADVVAQLGWTLQILYDSTGGRLCRFWRPPYGDADVRVVAIAREVFGLETVIWNQDTTDWNIGNAGITVESVEATFAGWLAGSKTNGLIALEHELTTNSVQVFMTTYPLIAQNGWTLQSLAQVLSSEGAYVNADGDTGTPVPVPLTAAGNGGAGLTTSTSSTTSTPSPTSTTNASKASSSPGNGVKKSGAAPRLRSTSLTLSMVASTLALAFSICLL